MIVSTTGCVQQDAQEDAPISQVRSFLATEHGPEDVLPSIPEVDGLDAESSREVGVLGNLRYFVAAAGEKEICLIIADSTSNTAGATCASDLSGMKTTEHQVGGAEFVTSKDEVPAGWTRLSDFLIVNPDATS